ncbi:MAG TPA: endo alpha-1,4 polygalactosaminidase [Solirubrobacterales bacterium]|nr:endo alpha-1,4 polygalactosaminidase [Solirubrobacterales bacterium]
MRKALIPAVLAALVLVLTPLAGAGGSDDPQLADAESFAFGIGNGMLGGNASDVADRLGGYDVVVVDGEEASAGVVAALQDEGSLVLAYLSVGTIEKWRGWYSDLKRYRLSAWQDWKDEWFADVSKEGLRDALADEIAPGILAKGFDGLFLDNVDMIEPKRHKKQRDGMRELVARLGDLVHSDGGLLFAQNGYWGFRRFGILDDGHLDGWNREDVTWTYDFDRRKYVRNSDRDRNEALDDLAAMHDRDLFTMATNYTKRSTGKAVQESIADACSAGALPFIGNIGLTAKRLPEQPYVCP